MCLRTLLVYLSLGTFLVVSEVPEDYGELIYTTIVYRHGDRTPIDRYPNDPYNNKSYWPVPWGELTDVGKRGQYELGKWLRNRYDGLLPKEYHSSDIYVRSTDVDRTLMSAYCNLAGLYEPQGSDNWNPDIRWNPIPVHTIPEKMDQVLSAEAPCPKYEEERAKLLESEIFRNIDKKYEKLYKYLTEKTGRNVTNISTVSDLYDTLFIENLKKYKLPEWTESVFPQPMSEVALINLQVPCYTKAMGRLKMGPLFNEILTNMEKKISGTLTQKAWMYSGHDSTIANILITLGAFQYHWPPYMSLILFELRRKNEQDYYVSMMYRNSTLNPPYLLRIPGCDKYCAFQRFKSILSDLIPKNWREECENVTFFHSLLNGATSIGFLTVLALLSLLFLPFVAVLKYLRNRWWNRPDFAYTILKMDVAS